MAPKFLRPTLPPLHVFRPLHDLIRSTIIHEDFAIKKCRANSIVVLLICILA